MHTSGAGILMALDIDSAKFGIEGTKIYDDWKGIDEITSLPEHAPHRETEKVILAVESSATDPIKTAIVCPPAIYGLGGGPRKQTRSQIHMLAAVALKLGKGIRIGEGANKWNLVHIQDLSNLYVLIGEAAISSSTECTWGLHGYYFAESEEVRWGEVSEMIAKIAFDRGLINSTQVAQLSIQDSNNVHPLGMYWWGTNSRSRALRARKLLGWEPRMPALLETLPEIVDLEARKLSMI